MQANRDDVTDAILTRQAQALVGGSAIQGVVVRAVVPDMAPAPQAGENVRHRAPLSLAELLKREAVHSSRCAPSSHSNAAERTRTPCLSKIRCASSISG